jgi:hypothetical protein
MAYNGAIKLGFDGFPAFGEVHCPPSRSVTARLRDSEPPILPDALALDLSIE